MPHDEHLNWSLDKPVPIKHSFWTLHPNIILWAMTTWIIGGHTVAIPYKWHSVGYQGGEWFEAPKKPRPEKNNSCNMQDIHGVRLIVS